MTIPLPRSQPAFTAGEIGASAQSRWDLKSYADGCDLIENGVVLVQGGITRRGGMRYLATLSASYTERVGDDESVEHTGDLTDNITMMPMFFSEDDGAVVCVYEGRLQVFDLAGEPLFLDPLPINEKIETDSVWKDWSLHNGDFTFGNGGMVIVGENTRPILIRRNFDDPTKPEWEKKNLFITNVPTRSFDRDSIDPSIDTIYLVIFSNIPKIENGEYAPVSFRFGESDLTEVGSVGFSSETTQLARDEYSEIYYIDDSYHSDGRRGSWRTSHYHLQLRFRIAYEEVVADNSPTNDFIMALKEKISEVVGSGITVKIERVFTSGEVHSTHVRQRRLFINDELEYGWIDDFYPKIYTENQGIRSVAPFRILITIKGQTNENKLGTLRFQDNEGKEISVITEQTSSIGSKKEAIWSNTRGYLRGVAYDNQRLIVASPLSSPLRAIFSKTIVDDLDPISFALTTTIGQGDNATEEVLADNGFSIKFESDDQSPLVDLFSGDVLFAYTQTGVFTIEGEKNPVDRFVVKHTDSYGMYAGSIAVSIDGTPHHITTDQKDIRRLVFSRDTQRFESHSISQINPERIAGVKGLSAQAESPYGDTRILHGWKEDGEGFLCSLSRVHGMAAFSGMTTQGKILSMVSVGQQTFAAVYREGAGTLLEEVNTQCPFDNCHVLSAPSTSDTPAIPRKDWVLPPELAYLDKVSVFIAGEGEDGFASGFDLGEHDVNERTAQDDEGNDFIESYIETKGEHTRIEVGIPFALEIHSTRAKIDTQRGKGRANPTNINSISLDFLNTQLVGVKYAQLNENILHSEWNAIGGTEVSPIAGQPQPLFTGSTRKLVMQGWGLDSRVAIRQENAGKFHLRGIDVEVSVNAQ